MENVFTARGVWKTPKIYQEVGELPVIASLRTITAMTIEDRLKRTFPQVVLSIGVGNGLIYQRALKEPLCQGKLYLGGIDISEEMLKACANNLPVPVKLTDRLADDIGRFPAVLAHQDALDLKGIEPGSLDVIEAILVLHHIPRRPQLQLLIKRVAIWLKPGGILIIGDVDVDVGRYLDDKETHLRVQYPVVERDTYNGVFVCKNNTVEDIQAPILDPDDAKDRLVIERLWRRTCGPLKEEAKLYGNDAVRKAIEDNIVSALKGGELHREISDWRELVFSGFNGNCAIEVIEPDVIKRHFPNVLDNPFILIATKNT